MAKTMRSVLTLAQLMENAFSTGWHRCKPLAPSCAKLLSNAHCLGAAQGCCSSRTSLFLWTRLVRDNSNSGHLSDYAICRIRTVTVRW